MSTEGKKKYEAHITFDKVYADKVKDCCKDSGWKYSQIDGDPVLGSGPRCYLTSYDSDFDKLKYSMDTMSRLCIEDGISVARKKIEQIIYDSVNDDLPTLRISLSGPADGKIGGTTVSALLHEILVRCGYQVTLTTHDPKLNAAPGYFETIKKMSVIENLLANPLPRCKIELVVI